MGDKARETSLLTRSPERLGIRPDGKYALWEVNDRKGRFIKGNELLKQGTGVVAVPGRGMKLFYLRELPDDAPHHLWGGKRISEKWDDRSGKLTVELHGPLGLEETVLIGLGTKRVREVRVNGKRSPFFLDPAQRMAHGKVMFGPEPVRIEVFGSSTAEATLPEKAVAPVNLPSR
jgi:hypothetical protein